MGDGVEKFFAGTGLIDVVLAATLLEWMALEMWWRITGRGLNPVELRFHLGESGLIKSKRVFEFSNNFHEIATRL